MRILLPLILLMTLSGCSTILHELQPHRLWRLNYHEPPGRTDDALFSIDDPLTPPEEVPPRLVSFAPDSTDQVHE